MLRYTILQYVYFSIRLYSKVYWNILVGICRYAELMKSILSSDFRYLVNLTQYTPTENFNGPPRNVPTALVQKLFGMYFFLFCSLSFTIEVLAVSKNNALNLLSLLLIILQIWCVLGWSIWYGCVWINCIFFLFVMYSIMIQSNDPGYK